MKQPVNPYESPREQTVCRTVVARQAKARVWYLVGSIAMFFGAPWCVRALESVGGSPAAEPNRHFIEIGSLGGQAFLIGFWSWIFGWFFLAFAWRRAALVTGTLATSLIVAFPALYDPADYLSAPWWTTLAAYALVAVGAWRLPRQASTNSERPET